MHLSKDIIVFGRLYEDIMLKLKSGLLRKTLIDSIFSVV